MSIILKGKVMGGNIGKGNRDPKGTGKGWRHWKGNRNGANGGNALWNGIMVIVILMEAAIERGQVRGNDIGQGNRSGANCGNAFCNGIGNRNRNLYGSGNIKGTGKW